MKNILIVDDDKTNIISAKTVLKDDYKITAVISGAHALSYLETWTPDLILLDINMPEMDGFTLLGEMRKQERLKQIPVIFLTADANPETETKCLEMGALDYISKPFSPMVMRTRIARTLELEELRRSLAIKLDETIREVTDIKEKTNKDSLTGLWNRNYAEAAINQLLQNGEQGTLFMIDMDNFKSINDLYGHLAGDHTLKIFANIMLKNGKEGDIQSRIGGDEFVSFLKGTYTKEEIEQRASVIIQEICKEIEDCKFETNTSVSIGIAQYPEDGTDFGALYNAADKALYYVKQNGKNSYHFFSEQKLVENERNTNYVDLQYLKDIMRRSDSGVGSYQMEYESFHHVYNFIRRVAVRKNQFVQMILFTLDSVNGSDSEVFEAAIEELERQIYSSLRGNDVSTKYSNSQLIVMLLDTNKDNGHLVAKRIMDNFMLNCPDEISISYDILEVEPPEPPEAEA